MRLTASGLLIALLAAPTRAENTPAPPDWRDGQGASVYLSQKVNTPAQQPATFSAPPIAAQLPRQNDTLVKQANHDEASSGEAGSRQLAPPSGRVDFGAAQSGRTASTPRHLADFAVPMQSAYTMVTGLAVVIGAFLLFTWVVRGGGKSSAARRGFVLPTEVVDVLGRVPIAARQFAQLLRVGNKLVLVALTPTGPTTLTEVTDPTEVDRLLGLCQQMDSKSTTKAFEQVFQQFTAEPAAGGFLGSDKLPTSLASAAYRSHRGAARA